MSKELILVVDDDRDLVVLLERILVEEGYQVATAYDGSSALTLLDEQKPDLIILDIMMPGINGLEMLNCVRQTHGIPVIMLSAKKDEATLRDAFDAGANDYIRKPFRRLELLARIRTKLRRA